MEPQTNLEEELQPERVWEQVFTEVRQRVDTPMLWFAMQSAKPLVVDGSYFVVGLPKSMDYMAINLENNEATTAIEEALQKATGRVLAFRLISGETKEEWYLEKVKEHVPAQPAYLVPPDELDYDAPDPVGTQTGGVKVAGAAGDSGAGKAAAASWAELNELLVTGYKHAPLIRYAHGQARYLLESVRRISDTMDLLMPGPGQPREEAQERALAKAIERLGLTINLDPIFISLELLRYRNSQGKDIGIP